MLAIMWCIVSMGLASLRALKPVRIAGDLGDENYAFYRIFCHFSILQK